MSDQTGAPTRSREVSRATTAAIETLLESSTGAFSLDRVSGTYHMGSGGVTTWYDFARAILDEVSHAPPNLSWLASELNGRPIFARHIVPITSAEYLTPARRPAYSVLSSTLLARTFGIRLPDWRAQLHSAFADR